MEEDFTPLIIGFAVLVGAVYLLHSLYAYVSAHILSIAITLSIFALMILLFFVFQRSEKRRKIREEEERRRKAEEIEREKQARLQRISEERRQVQYMAQLISMREYSVGLFEKMPTHISQAHTILDQADIDFEETAYSPFWRCIERAATEIGSFYDCVHMLGETRKKYQEISNLYKDVPPEFPIHSRSVMAMHSVDTATRRMDEIVRKAQRNFHFSTIYEQIKTQEVLIAGFRTLSGAIENLSVKVRQSVESLGEQLSTEISRSSSEISRSISDASAQISETISESNQNAAEKISTSVRETGSETRAEIEKMNASAKTSSAALLERQDRALRMFDNIQRRRRIFPPKPGDESY